MMHYFLIIWSNREIFNTSAIIFVSRIIAKILPITEDQSGNADCTSCQYKVPAILKPSRAYDKGASKF